MLGNNRFIRPPFIDPVTGIAYDTNNSEFEGYLTKQSLWLRVSLFAFLFDIFILLSTLFVIMLDLRLNQFRVTHLSYVIILLQCIHTGLA